MPRLKNTENYSITSIKKKEKLVYKTAFLFSPESDQCKLVVIPKVAHQMVTQNVIYKALMGQSILKVLELDKISFCILYIV